MFGSMQSSPASGGGGLWAQPQQAGMFGSTSSPRLFGTPAEQKGPSTSLFGTPAAGTATGGLFGSASQAQPSTYLFGTPAAGTTTGNLFGSASQAQPSTSLFGTPAAGTTTGGLFGSASQVQPSTCLFGTPAAGTTTGGLFGSASQAQPSTSLFGTPAAGTTTGGLFGSASQAQPSTSLFGTPAAGTTTGGLFGSASQVQPSTSLFGTPAAGTTTGGLFGSASQGKPSTPTFATALGGTPSGFLTGGGFTGASAAAAPATSLFQQPSLSVTPDQQMLAESGIPTILSNLSNADMRSYQVLFETYTSLKRCALGVPVLVAFTYEIDFNSDSLQRKQLSLEQQLKQMNNEALIESYIEARRKNPDPSRYAIVPLQNFEGVVKRAETQLQHLERVGLVLLEFKARQERIGTHMKIATTTRLDDIAKRQKCLQSALIRVVGLLEEYAIRNSRAQLDVTFLRRLQDDLAAMSEELHESGAGRNKLNDLRCRLSRLAQVMGVDAACVVNRPFQREVPLDAARFQAQGMDSGDRTPRLTTGERRSDYSQLAAGTAPALLSETDLKIVSNIIGKQKTLFESLGESLHQDLCKIKRLQQLTLTTTGPASNTNKTPPHYWTPHH